MSHAIGVDVGGTGIKAAVVDTATGELLVARRRLDTPRPATPEAVRDTIAELVGGFGVGSVATAFGFALAAMAGGTAYAVAFAALGVITTRALVVGLGYTLLWEGVLAGLLDGTRFLSIRQATLGTAAALTGEDVGVDVLEPVVAAAILVVVIVGGFLLTARALARFQVRSAD